MLRKLFRLRNGFPVSLFILSLSFLIVAGGSSPRRSWAETPEEKAQKEADKKAAEAKKKLGEMHKKAEESVDYKFDKFKASTQISARTEKVRSLSAVFSMEGDIFLWPSVNVDGEMTKDTNPKTPPEKIQLLFWARAKGPKAALYGATQELRFLVDGKPMGPYAVTYTMDRDGDDVIENMQTEMPYGDFYKVLAAKQSMQGRLGDTEFSFNDYQKILYTTFMWRISPGAK